MAEMSWKDAAKKVLEDSGTSLHYVDIADRILDQGLKKKFGATPHRTLNSVISTAIQAEGAACLFERTDTGVYALRGRRPVEPGTDDDAEAGSLEAFGMHWKREDVLWSSNPRLWGRIRPKADRVDLGGQLGVYVLYDDLGRIVYTGQAARQSIGRRLKQHTSDHLTGRWQRFSWFGIRPVGEDGKLGQVAAGTMTPERLISTLEALLIETLEPHKNRAGSSHSGIEYIQVRDHQL